MELWTVIRDPVYLSTMTPFLRMKMDCCSVLPQMTSMSPMQNSIALGLSTSIGKRCVAGGNGLICCRNSPVKYPNLYYGPPIPIDFDSECDTSCSDKMSR